MRSKFQNIFNRISNAVFRQRVQLSIRWVQAKFGSDNTQFLSRPTVGNMVFFRYTAKTETLPYYDSFPLVIILEADDKGFAGLNLHYLSPQLRAILMDLIAPLFSHRDSDPFRPQPKLSYDTVKQITRSQYFKPCYKRYSYEQLNSGLLAIHFDEWENAIFVPNEAFVGLDKKMVWKESKENIK